MTTTILPTRNEAWGFFGTMQTAGADPMQAWNAASAMIAAATEASAEGVRDFLDSRYGRHFADDVAGGLATGLGLEEAIESIRQLKGDAQAETLSCPDQTPISANDRAAAELEGTFRTSLTEHELAEAAPREVNNQNWGELTLRLEDGSVRYSQRNELDQFEASGTYSTDGDALEMRFDDYGETWVYRWSLYNGTLKLERDESLGVPPVRHTPAPLLIKPWRRVG